MSFIQEYYWSVIIMRGECILITRTRYMDFQLFLSILHQIQWIGLWRLACNPIMGRRTTIIKAYRILTTTNFSFVCMGNPMHTPSCWITKDSIKLYDRQIKVKSINYSFLLIKSLWYVDSGDSLEKVCR